MKRAESIRKMELTIDLRYISDFGNSDDLYRGFSNRPFTVKEFVEWAIKRSEKKETCDNIFVSFKHEICMFGGNHCVCHIYHGVPRYEPLPKEEVSPWLYNKEPYTELYDKVANCKVLKLTDIFCPYPPEGAENKYYLLLEKGELYKEEDWDL